MPLHGVLQSLFGQLQLFRYPIVPGNVPSGVASLKAMLTGDRQVRPTKDGVDVGNRATADQRQSTTGSLKQLLYQRVKVVCQEYL